MKKNSILIAGVASLAVLSLASCNSTTKGESVEIGSNNKLLKDVPDVPTYSELANKDLDIYINYNGEAGVTYRGDAYYNVVENKTYTQGSLLPTWSRLQEVTGTNIREASGYKASTNDNTYVSVSSAGYKSDLDPEQSIDLFYNSVSNIKKAGNSGTLVDLAPYIGLDGEESNSQMPNLYRYLKANPTIADAITTNGHIYYTPYRNGNDDVAKTIILDTDWVKKIFNQDLRGDTSVSGGTKAKANVLQTVKYQPFCNENEYTLTWYDSETGQMESCKTVYSPKSIIEEQNKNLKNGQNGNAMKNVLYTQMKAKYKTYMEKRGIGDDELWKLFVGETACYNVDELVALMRVIKANPGLLTGNPDAEIEVFVPRGESSDAIQSVLQFAQIWGVQGLDSSNGNYFFTGNGKISSLESSKNSYEALKNLSALYDEGLILENFYASSATPTANKYLDKYFKKTSVDNCYGFMMYDDPSVVTTANDAYQGIGTNASSRNPSYGENYSLTGFTSVLPPYTYWSTTIDGTNKSASDITNKTYTRYYESNRSLQDTSWCIPAASDNKDAAIRMMDVMYSDYGQLVQTYGPEEYWATNENGEVKLSMAIAPKENNPVLSDLTKLELVNSRLDYWSFMRKYIGAAHEIGYIRLKGANVQSTNHYGQTGLSIVNTAIENGTIYHGHTPTIEDGKLNAEWTAGVPQFKTSVTDDSNQWDTLTGFWAADKMNKNEGWVNIVVLDSDTSEENYVIKTAKNGKKKSYKDMMAEIPTRNFECLALLANSLDASYVPGWATDSSLCWANSAK